MYLDVLYEPVNKTNTWGLQKVNGEANQTTFGTYKASLMLGKSQILVQSNSMQLESKNDRFELVAKI